MVFLPAADPSIERRDGMHDREGSKRRTAKPGNDRYRVRLVEHGVLYVFRDDAFNYRRCRNLCIRQTL